MKKNRLRLLSVLVTSALMTACGGGKSDSSSSTILNFLESTNVASTGFPWNGQFAGVDKRWTLPIPVKINGETRAGPAMDALEAKLGYVIFDRTSIASVDDSQITRGVVFSKGTSYLPTGADPKQYCGNVSGAPYSGGYPSNFLKTPGEISTRLYVNLDNPQCVASADVTIHELGHAMGLGTHFQGFGNPDAISQDFYTVLATLYANPIGTPKASIMFKQVN